MNLRMLAASFAACGFTCFMLIQAANADTVFLETFDDGNAEDGMPVTWVPNGGTWDASSGDYIVGGPGLKRSFVPEHVLGDTSVRTQVRLSGEGESGRAMSILFRRQVDNLELGYIASLLNDGTTGFARVDPFTILGVGPVPFDVLGQDVMFQIDAFGDEFSLWAWPVGEPMPASPLVVVNDNTYAEGFVGVLSNETVGESTYRFVHVADTHIPEPTSAVMLFAGLIVLATVSNSRRKCV